MAALASGGRRAGHGTEALASPEAWRTERGWDATPAFRGIRYRCVRSRPPPLYRPLSVCKYPTRTLSLPPTLSTHRRGARIAPMSTRATLCPPTGVPESQNVVDVSPNPLTWFAGWVKRVQPTGEKLNEIGFSSEATAIPLRGKSDSPTAGQRPRRKSGRNRDRARA